MKFKAGMQFKSNRSHMVIEILKRQKDGYWHSKKVNGLPKAHRVAECTLSRCYEVMP
jgi:hypothetical protein